MHQCSVLKLLQVYKMCWGFLCVHMSGSHGGERNVHRAAAVRSGLYISAEERWGRGAAALKWHPFQDSNNVAELCCLHSLLSTLCQRWRTLTSWSLFCIKFFCILLHRCVFSHTETQSIVAWTGREGADCARGESSSRKHRTETLCQIPEVWSQRCGFAGCPVYQHCGAGTWKKTAEGAKEETLNFLLRPILSYCHCLVGSIHHAGLVAGPLVSMNNEISLLTCYSHVTLILCTYQGWWTRKAVIKQYHCAEWKYYPKAGYWFLPGYLWR